MMLRLIRACYEIRAIRGRKKMGLPLQAADRAILTRFEPLFRGPDGRRASRRLPTYTFATFRSASGVLEEGIVTDLSASGACVQTDTPLPVGSRTALRIFDNTASREYHFGCMVVRRTETSMGVLLLGIPVECRYGSRTQPPSSAQSVAIQL